MAERTKILITIDWFLPGTLSGGPVRSYANLIAHLKDDFEFYIITRNTDFGSNEPYEHIVPNTWVVYNSYTKIYYISPSQLNRAHFKKIIQATPFDVAYINGIYSWWFSILPVLLIRKTEKPIIVSARGMLNPQAFSVKKTKKKVYLKLARIAGVYKNVNFHATNKEEAQYIKNEIGATANVAVAPNLPRKASTELRCNGRKQNPVQFVNIARISIEKGTLRMIEGLNDIAEPLILDIYGPIYDTTYWMKCLAVIEALPKHIEVNYKGVLDSEEVPFKLSQYDYFVLLSEGENFGHAILEGLSVGLPVLISNRTPWKDLEAKGIGWDINATRDVNIAKTYTTAIRCSATEYQEWSQNAYNYAKQFIENPELIAQNKALFLNKIKNA